jgi:RNA polymerase sigma factor (sigma-70 family)
MLRFGRSMDSERVLLKKAAHGCRESLRAIYETHKDPLLTLARGMTGNLAEAEDVVHDVFVAFARNMPGLRLRTTLRAYLSVSVCNRVRDLGRARVRHRADANIVESAPEAAPPDVRVADVELVGRLREALRQLPVEQREVVVLRSKAGLSFKEIARHQGIAVNTAQGRYRYGIDKLRSLLNSELER